MNEIVTAQRADKRLWSVARDEGECRAQIAALQAAVKACHTEIGSFNVVSVTTVEAPRRVYRAAQPPIVDDPSPARTTKTKARGKK